MSWTRPVQGIVGGRATGREVFIDGKRYPSIKRAAKELRCGMGKVYRLMAGKSTRRARK